ncbi:hypothetical protein [Aurantimonas endophytica]|uniref:Uncharacterized protein n=1 Tax=Aurantimonas endophytica TaxID=1522175 RepID=A0A7W6HAM5_9HYPH|nr:hypothetical protein [Aurantimonas endophytica]MBB4001582.1 hypothetical protein [Aurantimonas endophytica]MCO6402778.1 hypothetical protein [Aurantimonas endophytica]
MLTLHLAGSSIEMDASGLTTTLYGDGSFVKAWPGDSAEDRARAVSLGYARNDTSLTRDSLVQMSREHEAGHAILASVMGLPHSPTLKGVADGRYWPHWQAEEAAVLAVQRYARMAGVDLVEVARRISGQA